MHKYILSSKNWLSRKSTALRGRADAFWKRQYEALKDNRRIIHRIILMVFAYFLSIAILLLIGNFVGYFYMTGGK